MSNQKNVSLNIEDALHFLTLNIRILENHNFHLFVITKLFYYYGNS